jgi:hypothetical protein
LAELDRLQTHGFRCDIGQNIKTVKVRIFATVFDLPARSSIYEHMQWNGFFGCMDCQDVGKKVDGVFIWPFAFASPPKSTQWYIDVYQCLKVSMRPSMSLLSNPGGKMLAVF